MITEDLKSAIETWQKEEGKKRAILLIAVEETQRNEDTHELGTTTAVLGSQRMLIEAVKEVKKDGDVASMLMKKADVMLLMEKMCQ